MEESVEHRRTSARIADPGGQVLTRRLVVDLCRCGATRCRA